MITKELLKEEINNISDKYYFVLYKIIKSFEDDSSEGNFNNNKIKLKQRKDWHEFIENTAGSLSDNPITRGKQGKFELREEFE